MKNYIWSIYNGRLVYQKRKNGVMYDVKTDKKLDPQPENPKRNHTKQHES